MSSQFSLLKQRRFAPFFVTQFLGAFNDNVFKNALVVLLTFQAASWTSLDKGLLANMAAGIFMLPFFLFSATSGQLADRFDKAKIARCVKLLEIGIIGIAGVGFALHSLTVLMSALFLLGLHSTLFGPVKYAILPQQLKPDELIGGNALVEAGTFVSILVGTIAGGALAAQPNGTLWITAASLAVAIAGYLTSRAIPTAPAASPELVIDWNPLTSTWANVRGAFGNRAVFTAIIGISWFWMYGALFLAQFPVYAKSILGGNEASVTLLLATFTVGIAIGSLLCEKLSRSFKAYWLIVAGGLGLTLFGGDFSITSTATSSATMQPLAELLGRPKVWHVVADLLGIGFSGGLFCVPLYTMMQEKSPVESRSRVIATNNIINALFMVVGALGAGALLQGHSLAQLFGLAAAINLGATAFLAKALWASKER